VLSTEVRVLPTDPPEKVGAAPASPVKFPPMIVGVPKEIKDQEYRVALLPSAAYQLVQRGHQVLVESNAGAGAER